MAGKAVYGDLNVPFEEVYIAKARFCAGPLRRYIDELLLFSALKYRCRKKPITGVNCTQVFNFFLKACNRFLHESIIREQHLCSGGVASGCGASADCASELSLRHLYSV